MIESIWTYTVKAEIADEFERRYSPTGDWARLFRRATGYGGTRLLRDVRTDRRYVTVDSWDSLEALHSFKTRFATEYEELDRICSDLTLEEQHVGIFAAVARD